MYKNVLKGDAVPLLAGLFRDAGLIFVDVGGRGSALRPLILLAPHAHYVTAEPDREEALRLQADLPQEAPWRGVTVIPAAIASTRGTAQLHMSVGVGLSSLLPPDPDVTRRFWKGRRFTVQSIVEVPTVPLDDAAAEYGFTDASFIKLDTQGTELDILQSGARLLTDSLIGIYTELEFRPFYRGQPVFADVDSYLRGQGFSLFSLSRTGMRRAGYRRRYYSRRTVTWAHCLYLREPDTLLELPAERARQQLIRLLGFTLAFQHFDVAFEIAGYADRVALVPQGDQARLVAELEYCAGHATREMLERAAKTDLAPLVLERSFRDKGLLE